MELPTGLISIHALLAESDYRLAHIVAVSGRFLSTLSLRRATAPQTQRRCQIQYFYPRSPCGERRVAVIRIFSTCGISIHALLAESDRQSWQAACTLTGFLSTLSLRRATRERRQNNAEVPIFLSTLSLRRATQIAGLRHHRNGISIHALLAESDLAIGQPIQPTRLFLSTLSLRRATLFGHNVIRAFVNFYPRSPCGERPHGGE